MSVGVPAAGETPAVAERDQHLSRQHDTHARTFTDETGFYSDRNIETVFKGHNQSLDNLQPKPGEKRHSDMRTMSNRMRTLFETASEDNGNGKAGRQIIHEMELILRRKPGGPQQ